MSDIWKFFRSRPVVKTEEVKKDNHSSNAVNNASISFVNAETVEQNKQSDVEPMPYLTNRNTVVIPCLCPLKYRWWAGGQSIEDTIKELGGSEGILKKYRFPYRDN